jgi:hypothetical protein
MKLIFPLLFSLTLFAQDYPPAMNDEQMQSMMASMQKMQACMSQIDLTPLSQLEQEATIVEKEINALCQNGKRDTAQKKAISFSKKVFDLNAMKELKACVKDSPYASMMQLDEKEFEKRHVCDGEKIKLGVPSQQRINW